MFLVAAAGLVGAKLALLLPFGKLPLLGDELTYWEWSRGYLAHYWSTDEQWAPLQFAYLCLVRMAFPAQGLMAARVINLLLQTATAALLMGIGRELEDDRVGLAAGLCYLILPEPVSYAYTMFSETLAALFLAGFALCYLRTMDRTGRAGLIFPALTGFGFALLALTRAINFYFLPLWLLHYYVFARQSARRKLIAFAAIVVALAAPISIHAVKNYRLYHEFAPLNTNSWVTFWTAYNHFPPPDHNFYGGFYQSLQHGFNDARPNPTDPGPAGKQRTEIKIALHIIASDPGLALRRALWKINELFHPSLFIYRNFYLSLPGTFMREHLTNPWTLAAISMTYVAMMLTAGAGLVFCPERRVRALTLLLVAFHVALAGVFFGPTRFRMGFLPLLMPFMAWAMVHGRELWRQKWSRRGLVTAVLWAAMATSWALAAWRLIRP